MKFFASFASSPNPLLLSDSPLLLFDELSFQQLTVMSSTLEKCVLRLLKLEPSCRLYSDSSGLIYCWYLLSYHHFYDAAPSIDSRVPKTFAESLILLNYESYPRYKAFLVAPSFPKILNSILSSIRNLIRLSCIGYRKSLTHYSANLCGSAVTINNLTSAFYPLQTDHLATSPMRLQLKELLLSESVSSLLADLICDTFPASHLENYLSFKNNPITKLLKPASIFTTGCGLMEDPLLEHVVLRNSSELVFVAHGGGYGLHNNLMLHYIEEACCNKFLYWGIGPNGIKQTRFKSRRIHESNNVVFALSCEATPSSIEFFINLKHKINEAHRFPHLDVVICLHPDSPYKHLYPDCSIGTNYMLHANALLVVYDSLGHTLMWDRIAQGLPFLACDMTDIQPAPPSANNTNELLCITRSCSIYIHNSCLANELMSLFSFISFGIPLREQYRYIKFYNWYKQLPTLADIQKIL